MPYDFRSDLVSLILIRDSAILKAATLSVEEQGKVEEMKLFQEMFERFCLKYEQKKGVQS